VTTTAVVGVLGRTIRRVTQGRGMGGGRSSRGKSSSALRIVPMLWSLGARVHTAPDSAVLESDDAEDTMTSPDTPEQDHAAREAGSFAEHVVPMGGRMVRELHEVADEIAKEGQAQDRLLDGIASAVAEQPSAVGDGVDLTAITRVEPEFDPAAFRAIARETFLKVREARSTLREQEDDGLLTPALERKVDDGIFSDAAAGRRHVLSGLEITEATVVSAIVAGGREKLGVRFVATAEHIDRNDRTGTVLSDDGSAHSFTELWQFERNPALDSSATDAQHAASFGADDWLFAHRGWVVTDIQPEA
jgi:predicted lipid-binding transport protein (Tim44 family)